MAWFSKASPIPSFPAYTGPYQVGSVDVEIPVAELEAPSPAPHSAPPTVAFRVFYPCEPSSSSKRPVRWVPSPQRDYLSSYAAFTGAGSLLSNAFSYLSHFMTYVTIPVIRNARLLPPPTANKRWPVMVFSHGLAGSRNAYSQICGSLSSHGIVVIAADHRDGSAPITHIRATPTSPAQSIKYLPIPHHQTEEVFKQRHKQLSTRLWELGLVHDAVQRIDRGNSLTNLDLNSNHHRKKDRSDVLSMFKGLLHVHDPGVIAWAGHSFGAASVVQFVKSTYWRVSGEQSGYDPLFTPANDSSIVNQITPNSPVILLDLWCLPLTMPQLKWLKEKPLPCYSESGPGGYVLLAVLSEAFYKWKSHLEETRRILAENPSSPGKYTKPPPQFFYRASSAHLSQSDFGLLYPWLTEKVLKAEEPEETIRLNTRAILQVLRNAGLQVAKASKTDAKYEADEDNTHVISEQELEDKEILQTDGIIKGWVALTTDLNSATNTTHESSEEIDKSPSQAVMDNEILSKISSR